MAFFVGFYFYNLMGKMWSAIVPDGNDKDNIWVVVDAIKKKLIEKSDTIKGVGLLTGKSGSLLFMYEYYKATGNEEVLDYIFILLNEIFDLLENSIDEFKLSFANGLAGILWLINYIQKDNVIEIDATDLGEDVQDVLYQQMCLHLKSGHYDYLHGGGGIGLCFMGLDSDKSSNYIRSFFAGLINAAIIKDSLKPEIAWSHFDNVVNVLNEGNYNMGLAHGLPSIILLLLKIPDNLVDPETRRYYISGCANFILSNKILAVDSLSIFPWEVSENSGTANTSASRLAWCYGDPGVGFSLLKAGYGLNDRELKNEALNILKHAAQRRDPEENMLVDADLCHGTAGVAFIFNKVYQLTGDAIFKEASMFWLAETLKLYNPDTDGPGFLTWNGSIRSMVEDYSLLVGLSGVGLSLLSFVSDNYPGWDEILLLS
jgi:lantibiotic modifying enzyme